MCALFVYQHWFVIRFQLAVRPLQFWHTLLPNITFEKECCFCAWKTGPPFGWLCDGVSVLFVIVDVNKLSGACKATYRVVHVWVRRRFRRWVILQSYREASSSLLVVLFAQGISCTLQGLVRTSMVCVLFCSSALASKIQAD